MRIKVNGKYYEFFNEVSISTSLDSVASTFAFSVYFDPSNPLHRELCRPLAYHKVEFFDETRAKERNKGLLSTGTITNHSFASQATPSLVVLSGYSLPGVLEDCQIPFNFFNVTGSADGVETISLESNGLNLEQVVNKMIRPFGLNVIVYPSVKSECASIIPKTVASVEQTVKDYICKVANQKNVVVSHDIHGNLILFRPTITAAPQLSVNPENTLSMGLTIDGQALHSTITTIRQPEKNGDTKNPFSNQDAAKNFDADKTKQSTLKIANMETVKNPIIGAFRPFVDILSSGTFYDTHRASLNKRAAELKNIKVQFSLNYWPVVSVGDVVELTAPDLFINKKVRMILESTVISQNKDSQVMSGSLVMPETFTGGTPVNIFQ